MKYLTIYNIKKVEITFIKGGIEKPLPEKLLVQHQKIVETLDPLKKLPWMRAFIRLPSFEKHQEDLVFEEFYFMFSIDPLWQLVTKSFILTPDSMILPGGIHAVSVEFAYFSAVEYVERITEFVENETLVLKS